MLLVAVFGGQDHKASAQAPALEPTWAIDVAPDSICAADPEFAEVLTAKIPERQRATVAAAELRARVFVSRDKSATVAVLDQQTGREAGQRRVALSEPGCRAAAETLAFVIAVMVEAGHAALPAETALEPKPDPQPPPAPPAPPAPAPSSASGGAPAEYKRPERHAWQGPPAGHDLLAAFGTNIGLLPGWSIGGSGGWGIRGHKIWPVWITGTGWLTHLSEDGKARFGAAYGGLSACPLYLQGTRFRGRLCPGFAVGALWAQGRQDPVDQRKVSTLALAVLDAAVHLRLVGPLELILDARLEVPLVRLEFVYYRSDGAAPQVHQTAAVAGSFFGGLGLRFR